MYNNIGSQPGVQPPPNTQPNPFGSAFQVAGSGLIRGGLGAYGGKILGSSSEGHWTRITEPVGGRLSYKPPIYDINAPDLYIPLMAFGTYVVLAGLSLGLHGKFSPEALNLLFIKGLLGRFMQAALLKVTLLSLGSGEAPLLDIIAYAGYTFTGICLAVLGRIISGYSYYFLMPWTCLCMGVFLVKTMKRVLFAKVAPKGEKKPAGKKPVEEKMSTIAEKTHVEKKPKAGKKLPKDGGAAAGDKKKKSNSSFPLLRPVRFRPISGPFFIFLFFSAIYIIVWALAYHLSPTRFSLYTLHFEVF